MPEAKCNPGATSACQQDEKKKILPSNYKVSRLVPEYRQGYIQEHWNIIQAASDLTLLYLTRKHAVQLAK